ncbi:MAG: CotH kinase family protein [Fibrobacter sp.]|nr:CotH kinase family protein [Fibrobacter sp.]
MFFPALLLFWGGCFWDSPEEFSRYLPLDDSEYPYADLPRVVIEIEGFHEIRDTEREYSARLQIYGDTLPCSDVYELTVRGRGNSSSKMPKYGLKLEFKDKVEMFGMPKNRDWALIANFGDKTHLRNYMMTRISEWLMADYTPKMQFVELYLNRKYMGLYLFAETVKVSRNRVNIVESDSSFLFEKEDSKKLDSPNVTTDLGNSFHVKSPRDLTEESSRMLREHLNQFELLLTNGRIYSRERFESWVDMDDFLLYYWIQEFSRNEDGGFARSTFMTWEKDGPIRFGPLWDFDLAFGNASLKENRTPEDWFIRTQRWYRLIFRNAYVDEAAKNYWNDHKELFHDLIDSVPVYRKIIEKALKNEYRRWPVMGNTENWALKEPYDSYDEGIEIMVQWMKDRYDWICLQIGNGR